MAFLSAGLFLAPIINGGKDPKYQKLGVDILFWALVVLVVGSFAGTYLGVAHCKLTTLDIRNIPGLTTFYAGSQSNSAGFSQMITVTMTQAQKTKFGNIFFENASGPNNNYEGSNNYVKINVQ